MILKVCKVTGRLDIVNLDQKDLEKLVKARVIAEVTTGTEIKYYMNPFKFPEIEQNPTLNKLFGKDYPGPWRHGPYNPTILDMSCNSEVALEAIRKWIDLTYQTC